MNASQRRITRRSTLRVLPVGTIVSVPTGTEAKVTGVNNIGREVIVKFKNNRTAAYAPFQLKRAA